MNAYNSNTLRQTWRKFYRISRMGRATPRNLVTLLSDECARVYLDALHAVTMRDGYFTALMSRPIPSVDVGRWLVNTRCTRYNAHAGRLPI